MAAKRVDENSNPSFHASVTVPIRYADCDLLGHLNHAKFFTYMEEARAHYFSGLLKINFTQPFKPPYLSFIIADAQCTYKSPAYYGETLVVKIRVSELGNSSCKLEYAIVENDSSLLVATGKTIAVLFNYKESKSLPFPEELRKRIEMVERREFPSPRSP